jgi:hypothetical protein
MKRRYFYPLIGFILPAAVIGYGIVIPHSCIAGMNPQSIGFGTTLLGAGIAYCAGLRKAISDLRADKEQ